MTTLHRLSVLGEKFDGISPRLSYKASCLGLGVKPQRSVSGMLTNTVNDFGKMQKFVCSHCILGPKGCMAILPIIEFSRNLRSVEVRGCNVTDEFLINLCEILREHPSVRLVDLGENPLISVECGRHVISLLKENKNILRFDLDQTHIGANVANLAIGHCMRNYHNVKSYFSDEYFKMRNIFNYLDEDGSGWIHPKSLVLSLPYYQLQERLIERIALKHPKRRTDGNISVNSFMELVYINYKTEQDIADLRNKEGDEYTENTRNNWKGILSAIEAYSAERLGGENMETSQQEVLGIMTALPPADLYRLRLPKIALHEAECSHLVSLAVMDQHQADTDAKFEGLLAEGREAECTNPAECKGDIQVQLTVQHLRSAYMSLFQPEGIPSRQYNFLRDRDENYISPLLRVGSRCGSIGQMSFGNDPDGDAMGEEENEDPPHTWQLSATMVRKIEETFNAFYVEDNKGLTHCTETEAQRKDRTMQKREIPLMTMMGWVIETDTEKLRLAGLCSKFVQFSIPVDVTCITLQEIINLVDEFYVEIQVNKQFTLDDIRQM